MYQQEIIGESDAPPFPPIDPRIFKGKNQRNKPIIGDRYKPCFVPIPAIGRHGKSSTSIDVKTPLTVNFVGSRESTNGYVIKFEGVAGDYHSDFFKPVR